MDEYLLTTIEEAEAVLEKAIRARLDKARVEPVTEAQSPSQARDLPRNAWRRIKVYFSDTMPVFAGNPVEQGGLLGAPSAPRGREWIPHRAIKAVAEIRRHVAHCSRCRAAVQAVPDSLKDHASIAAVSKCDEKLFSRYLKAAQHVPELIDEGPEWRAAYVAAVADAARKSDDPTALFAAGRYLERQRLIEYLLRRLPKEARGAAVRALNDYKKNEPRRKGKKGVEAGAGTVKRSHSELVRRAVDALVERKLEPSAANVRLFRPDRPLSCPRRRASRVGRCVLTANRMDSRLRGNDVGEMPVRGCRAGRRGQTGNALR